MPSLLERALSTDFIKTACNHQQNTRNCVNKLKNAYICCHFLVSCTNGWQSKSCIIHLSILVIQFRFFSVSEKKKPDSEIRQPYIWKHLLRHCFTRGLLTAGCAVSGDLDEYNTVSYRTSHPTISRQFIRILFCSTFAVKWQRRPTTTPQG